MSFCRLAATAWIVAVCALPAVAGDPEDGWQVVATQPYRVLSRPLKGSPVPEFWARAYTRASPLAVQEVLGDIEHFTRWMPYMKEARLLGDPAPDGSVMMYVRISPPVISPRDYVSRAWTEAEVSADGTGTMKTRWVSVPDVMPVRKDSVRIKLNAGSWEVYRGDDGRTVIEYRFTLHPGGWVPGWVVDMANKMAVNDVLTALVKESEAHERAGRPPRQPRGGTRSAAKPVPGDPQVAPVAGVAASADGGTTDAGARGDAGIPDAGGRSAIVRDGGLVIAPSADGGTPDGGAVQAGPDGGTGTGDAGTPVRRRRR